MVYSYRNGGVNGFCRYVDTTMLDRSLPVHGGAPKEAAQWVRELDVDTVVPYATFTFNPRATPGEVADLLSALRQEGLNDRLLPLPTQGAVEPIGPRRLCHGAAATAGLQQWFATGARVSAASIAA